MVLKKLEEWLEKCEEPSATNWQRVFFDLISIAILAGWFFVCTAICYIFSE